MRLGSYSIAATRAGTPSLRRLKSIRRYRRLAPPPRWREVLRPNALRPPLFFRPSTSERSGSVFGDLGEVGVGDEAHPRARRLGLADRHQDADPSRPAKIGIVSPARTCTIAFFQRARAPARDAAALRLGLDRDRADAPRRGRRRAPRPPGEPASCARPAWTRKV